MSAAPIPALPCAPDAIDDFLATPTPGAVAAIARAAGPFLVLGAGGKMGLHLSVMLRRALTASGRADRVVAVSRFQTLRDRADFEARGVETLACDLADEAALAALPAAPTIFFMAGVKFGTASDPALLRRINAEMPRQVARRYAASRIVAYSSGNIYPFVAPASGGATEDMPPAPVGDYAASCLARERAFADISAEHGTAVALVRLNYSVEFRYGVLVDIAQAVLVGRPIDLAMGHLNAIWQSDAVAHSLQAIELCGSPVVPINVTGAGILSVRDIALRFGAVLGRTPQFAGTEAPTALLNNAARSHRRFGTPAVSVDQMIAWIAAWLGRGGNTWGKPTGFQQRDGKF